VRAAAHAAIEATTTDAAMNDLRVVGLEATRPGGLLPIPGLPELDTTVLGVDSMTARTDQRIDDTSTLVVESVSTLQGVRLAGGLVRIGSIRSRSVITDDGEGTQGHEATLEVSGVTVGGVPAQITEDGLVLGSPGGSGPISDQLTRTLNQMLGDLGVEATALEAESGVDEAGLAFARSGGVVIEFGFPVQGLPPVPGPMGDVDLDGFYEGSIVLGATGARGVAAAIPPFEVEPVTPVLDTDASLPATGATPSFDTAVPGPPSGAPTGSTPAGTGTGSGGSQVTPTQLASVLDPLVADLRWVYLAFTLTGFGLALSTRLTLPARLPRSAS
jgi:hypothetical protein